MQWRARVVAPVLAGVLGVTGGAVTAAFVGASSSTSFADPEHLGVRLANLACSGEYLLVVAHGEGGSALGTGVANNRSAGVRYLDTSKSCRARLGPDGDRDPAFVAYLGPYADPAAPCAIRMHAANRSDLVAPLSEGSTQLVKCPCVLPTKDAPTLSRQTELSDDDLVWARSLQTMLRDYANHEGDPLTGPDAPPKVSGTYDEATREYIIKRFQTPAGLLGRGGVMDAGTWRIVTDRICPIYDES